MKKYKVIFELVANVNADDIYEVEKRLKKRFADKDLKFRQLIDYDVSKIKTDKLKR